MPTYGYRCGTCGHEFEIQQKITDAPLKTCPKCKGKLAKMVYPAGIIFTGSGYYTTDYKQSGKSGEAASSNGATADKKDSSQSKPDTKSESKPEAKPESKPDSKTEKAS